MDPVNPPPPTIFAGAPLHPSSPLSSLPPISTSSPPPFSSPLNRVTRIEYDNNWVDNEDDDDQDWIDSGGEESRATHSRRSRAGTAYGLQQVLQALRRCRWTFKDLIHNWVQEEDKDNHEVILEHRSYKTAAQRRRVLVTAVESLVASGVDTTTSTLLAEFNHLLQTPFLGQFDHTTNVDTIDFHLAFQDIKATAPVWHKLLTELLRNQRSHWSSYNACSDKQVLSKRVYFITSVICHSRAKKRSNLLPSILDMYLLGSGVKRRVIETLSGLGICHSYMTANRLISKVSENAKASKIFNPES